MSRLSDIEARVRSLDTKLAAVETGLRQDITTLKAAIEALQQQTADPVVLASLEGLLTSLESRATSLTTLDSETPPPTPPV